MNCPRCGGVNAGDAKFCTTCGGNLESTAQNQNINQQTTQDQIFNQQPIATPNVNQQTINYRQENQQERTIDNSKRTNYFVFMVAVLLKPMRTLREEINKFNNPKVAIMFSGIVAIIMTLLNLFHQMYSAVKHTEYDFWTGESTTEYVWENLKELNYVNLLGKNFLIYLAVLAGISVIYFLATLVIKKSVEYTKILTITSVAAIPSILSVMVLSPLLSLIYAPLGLIIVAVGLIYSFLIFVEGINEQISFEDNDQKIYFNLACLTALIVIAYYLIMRSISGMVENTISDMFSMLN